MNLTILGYTSSILDLPSTTTPSSTSTSTQPSIYETDISTIETAIAGFVDVGRDVVLVMHGHSGNAATQAANKFSLSSRKQIEEGVEEITGVVRKLVYLAAWLPVEGQEYGSFPWDADAVAYSVADEKVCSIICYEKEKEKENSGFDARIVFTDRYQDDRFVHANQPRDLFYNDIVDTRTVHMAITALEPKAVDREHDSVGPNKCAWREVPCAYILCEQDRVFPPAIAEFMIEKVKAEGVDVAVERLKSGHAPMLSMPRETSQAIVNLIAQDS